jgi:hypothetical protein
MLVRDLMQMARRVLFCCGVTSKITGFWGNVLDMNQRVAASLPRNCCAAQKLLLQLKSNEFGEFFTAGNSTGAHGQPPGTPTDAFDASPRGARREQSAFDLPLPTRGTAPGEAVVAGRRAPCGDMMPHHVAGHAP